MVFAWDQLQKTSFYCLCLAVCFICLYKAFQIVRLANISHYFSHCQTELFFSPFFYFIINETENRIAKLGAHWTAPIINCCLHIRAPVHVCNQIMSYIIIHQSNTEIQTVFLQNQYFYLDTLYCCICTFSWVKDLNIPTHSSMGSLMFSFIICVSEPLGGTVYVQTSADERNVKAKKGIIWNIWPREGQNFPLMCSTSIYLSEVIKGLQPILYRWRTCSLPQGNPSLIH